MAAPLIPTSAIGRSANGSHLLILHNSRRSTSGLVVVMGRAEREKFEERRSVWRPRLVELYDKAKNVHRLKMADDCQLIGR